MSGLQKTTFEKEFNFLRLARNLKMELRHSWLSSDRRESVADHIFRLSLMVMRYADKLDQPVNVFKCLQMAVIHDFAEAMVGDVPVLDSQTVESKKAKEEAEHRAMLWLKEHMNDENFNAMYDLWLQYESQESYESKFVKALDKLEAFIQHNEDSLETWEFAEKVMLFEDKWLRRHCAFDSFLKKFSEAVIQEGLKKLKEAGEDLNHLAQCCA